MCAFFSRGPNKIQQPYTMPDIYASYISGKSKDHPYYVTYKEFVDICAIFYQMISKSIIDDSIRFKLPFAMGEVFVMKRKVKYNSKMPIDWALTLQEGKRMYNFNEHTGGFGYKFFWTRPYKIKNKFMYRLVLTRQNKRALAKAIKQQKKDYFER
jgi:hypothetical protein